MSDAMIWTIVILLGAGTYLIRFSFLGIIGAKELPPLVLQLLRFAPVAVLPGLVAPLVVWPAATGGDTDPVRLSAALVTLAAAYVLKSMLWGAVIGGATLALLLQLA